MTQFREGILNPQDTQYVKWGDDWLLISQGTPLSKYKVVGLIWHKNQGILCHGNANAVLSSYGRQDFGEEPVKFIFFKIMDSAVLLNTLIQNIDVARSLYDDTDFELRKKSELN